jgi:parallel beta-helix repeat protein
MKGIAAATGLLAAVVLYVAGCAPAAYSNYGMASRLPDLQAMLDTAADGSTVVIPKGKHVLSSGLVLGARKRVTITAEPGTRVFVADVMQHVLDLSTCESIRIENLHLRHVKPLRKYECHGAGIHLDDCRAVTIENCELDGCGAFGVAANYARNLTIRNCFIHHNTFTAVYLYGCETVLVRGNRFKANADRFTQYSVTGFREEENRFE